MIYRANFMNLYIHVPFCIKKCNYCAFYSRCPAVIDWDEYVAGILRQLDWFHASDYEIKTLFFGGGTPSLMPVEYAGKIIEKLHLSDDSEFTVEANPKTLSSLELKDWKDFGLNRLSIGMQSFNDKDLEFLGRIHSVRDSMELLAAAFDLGLRASGDFIYGLPNQSVADVVKMCEEINHTGLPHASLYELTIERGTPFQNMKPISESFGAEMYLAIQSALKLPRYEISNYGNPCRHNANIWAGEEYIGVGESAAGRIKVNSQVWIETKIVDGEVAMNELTARERAVEIVIMGLRTMRGVKIEPAPRHCAPTPSAREGASLRDYINWDFVRENPAYFIHDSESLRMTDSGLLLLDGLMVEIII
jgi:oxygen-independent coproporphyrinogen-3 oxidase